MSVEGKRDRMLQLCARIHAVAVRLGELDRHRSAARCGSDTIMPRGVIVGCGLLLKVVRELMSEIQSEPTVVGEATVAKAKRRAEPVLARMGWLESFEANGARREFEIVAPETIVELLMLWSVSKVVGDAVQLCIVHQLDVTELVGGGSASDGGR